MPVLFIFCMMFLLLFGVRGLLVGAALGYLVNSFMRSSFSDRLAAAQTRFVDSAFAVMGAVCKADGVVTRNEIAIAESMFDKLNLSSEQRSAAKAAFNRGKAPTFNLDAEVTAFAHAARGQRPLAILFLQIQCAAVASDGEVHPAEQQILTRIAHLLGLTAADVEQLEALLRTGTRRAGAAPRRNLDDAYAALGLNASASDTQIKQAYRRLMSQNHPDKLAGKGLPESMRALAEERTREIGVAYAMIKEARGFT